MKKHCVKTRTIGFWKQTEWYRNWLDLRFLVYVLHCSELDWVVERVAGHVMCKPARTEDLCHWPAVLRSIRYVGERLCMQRVSQQLIFLPLLHGFNNSSVSSAVPYSCLLFSMCNAYAEIGLLVLTYRVCVLYVFLLLSFLSVLHMNCCKCYIWVCISCWNLCRS